MGRGFCLREMDLFEWLLALMQKISSFLMVLSAGFGKFSPPSRLITYKIVTTCLILRLLAFILNRFILLFLAKNVLDVLPILEIV
jgi:hypothetical protein